MYYFQRAHLGINLPWLCAREFFKHTYKVYSEYQITGLEIAVCMCSFAVWLCPTQKKRNENIFQFSSFPITFPIVHHCLLLSFQLFVFQMHQLRAVMRSVSHSGVFLFTRSDRKKKSRNRSTHVLHTSKES